MTWQAWLTLAVVGSTVILLASERVAPAVGMMGANALLLITGVVSAEQALQGFGNAAPITVAALYVIARAVEKTGALRPIIAAALGSGSGERGRLARLLLPSAAASAFLNNTPIVAMLAPQVEEWAGRRGVPPSRYLMPLSFAVILGGVVTVIGTSTNLVVSGLLETYGEPSIGMFEISLLGLPVALLGLLTLICSAPLLLPDRGPAWHEATEKARDFTLGMQVVPGGPLDGATVARGLRHLPGVCLAAIERRAEVRVPAGPEDVLQAGDRLTFAAPAERVVQLQQTSGLVSAERAHTLGFSSGTHRFFEAVIGSASPVAGRTLSEVSFRARYQAAVVAIHRAGERVSGDLGAVRLRVGDTLLLIADPGFRARWRDRHDFLLISPLDGSLPIGGWRAALVGVVGLGVIVLAGAGLLPILHATLLGALTLIGARVLSLQEAGAAVNLDVVVMIAASFGLGAAIQVSGLADLLAAQLVGAFQTLGSRGVLLGITLAVVALTELITNNAAAALLLPIAMSAAHGLGSDPRPYAIAVAIAASASFLTPIGYQTNTMVYGPGGYRFGDFARLGVPLTLVVIAAIVGLTPLLWEL